MLKAESPSHTTAGSRKWHRNGIKKPRSYRYESLNGVRLLLFFFLSYINVLAAPTKGHNVITIVSGRTNFCFLLNPFITTICKSVCCYRVFSIYLPPHVHHSTSRDVKGLRQCFPNLSLGPSNRRDFADHLGGLQTESCNH
uniref:60S ribosomal protein L29 n=1 Tax=Leptobrachium leishanense TaxID=445787 RepID=A0A8C5R334_9ANUR